MGESESRELSCMVCVYECLVWCDSTRDQPNPNSVMEMKDNTHPMIELKVLLNICLHSHNIRRKLCVCVCYMKGSMGSLLSKWFWMISHCRMCGLQKMRWTSHFFPLWKQPTSSWKHLFCRFIKWSCRPFKGTLWPWRRIFYELFILLLDQHF